MSSIIVLKKIATERLVSSILVAVFVVAPLLQLGCFKPAAALTFVNNDNSAESPAGDSEADLDPGSKRSIQRYGSLIQRYSYRYEVDWRLVLALMRHESMFDSSATSHSGAFGLMQIMPSTQVELVEKLGMEEAISPQNNIRAGVYHLRSLYGLFAGADGQNRIRLTLGAYNAGFSRILDAQDVARYLGDDPNDWDAIRAVLPLLSRRYYTLHQNIWEEGKPRAGYFRDWTQTQTYVESIMQYYDEYQLALP